MNRIVHHELGEPSRVLRVEDGPSEPLGPNQVRVRPSYAPIHPGDLLGIMGSPAFGTPPTIGPGGRVPGFEGAGVVSEVGALVDAGLGLRPGLRVAFFPAPGSWRDEVIVPAGSVVPLPDSIPDEIGAQLLINTATAVTAIRTAHKSVPPNARTGVVVLLTAAGSAVGRLLGKLLTDRGVKPRPTTYNARRRTESQSFLRTARAIVVNGSEEDLRPQPAALRPAQAQRAWPHRARRLTLRLPPHAKRHPGGPALPVLPQAPLRAARQQPASITSHTRSTVPTAGSSRLSPCRYRHPASR